MRQVLMTNNVGTTLINRWGNTGGTSSGFDTRTGFSQFPLFNLELAFITGKSTSGIGRNNWWIRNVASSTTFALVFNDGTSYIGASSSNCGVRPYFLIN